MEIYNLIKSGLNVAQLRSETDYKRKYVSFEETLDDINNAGKIEVKEDNTTSIRSDGNNVDLENEKVNQAANTLMYNGLVSITNIKLTMSKSVITGR